MQPRLLTCLSATFAACVLLLAPALAQVSLLTRGQGLSPEDNRLLFESIARLKKHSAAEWNRACSGRKL